VRTIANPVAGTEVRVKPVEDPGITVNGVPATLDAVSKADVRVDIVGETRSFVVEHALGALGLCGITAADVTGIRSEWDFARPEHRFCYSAEMGPRNVVGHPEGLPNPALAEALGNVEVLATEPTTRATVTEPVSLSNDHGSITIAPRELGAGIRFSVRYGDSTFECEVDPAGENDPDLIESVTTSTTPYLSPSEEEAVVHSIADLVSDIAVIGGFDDLAVDADLGGEYHTLTVGVARAARDRDLTVERQA
jgi:hypothetical protein